MWYRFWDYVDLLPVEDNVNKIVLILAISFFVMALVEIIRDTCKKEVKNER